MLVHVFVAPNSPVTVRQALGGRGIPGRIGSRLPSGHLRRTQALYNEAKDLLTFLKSFGAFLHHVRPEQLLNRCVVQDFMAAAAAAVVVVVVVVVVVFPSTSHHTTAALFLPPLLTTQ